MIFPKEGECLEERLLDEMATIEHHLANELKKGDNIEYLVLTHKKCNI